MKKAVEADDLARFVKADQVAHPAEQRLRRPARENWMIECHFLRPRLVGTYEKPRCVPKNLSWVHPGFGVTLASHETSKDPRRWSMRPDRVQIEPAGVTAGYDLSRTGKRCVKTMPEDATCKPP